MNRIIALGVLILVLGGAILYNVRARQTPAPTAPGGGGAPTDASISVTTAKVDLGSLTETINAVGVVRSSRLAAVSARMPARILSVSVREGEHVSAGQTLVNLDDSDAASQLSGAQAGVEGARAQVRKAMDAKHARQVELDSQVAQAKIGLENAKVKLHQAELGARLQETSSRSDSERARAAVLQAESGVKQAELALDQADKTLKRVEFLYAHGGVPRADAEGARTQAAVARAQKDGAVAALRQAQAAEKPTAEAVPLRDRVSRQDIEAAQLGVRQAEGFVASAVSARTEALHIADRDVEAAGASLKQAEAGRRGAHAQVGNTTLTSPISGIVTELTAHAGENAQPGQTLLTVVSADDVFIEAAVPARFASVVHSRAAAQIKLESARDPIAGYVSGVLPIGQGDGRTVPVRVVTGKRDSRLIPGLSATVTITAELGSPQSLVPVEAVRTENERHYVYTIVSGVADKREVRTGRSDGRRVEILSGLAPHEVVIVTSQGVIAPGARVIEQAPAGNQ